MNILLKQIKLTCLVVLVSACSTLQKTQSDPTPEFSHSTPIRQMQKSEPIQKNIQSTVVYFDSESHELNRNAKKKLVEFLGQLTGTSWPPIAIEGHTDSNDSEDYNLILSKQRTQSVKKTLIQLGYPADLAIEIAKGEIQPIASNATASGRRLNRRVEIKIYRELVD